MNKFLEKHEELMKDLLSEAEGVVVTQPPAETETNPEGEQISIAQEHKLLKNERVLNDEEIKRFVDHVVPLIRKQKIDCIIDYKSQNGKTFESIVTSMINPNSGFRNDHFVLYFEAKFYSVPYTRIISVRIPYRNGFKVLVPSSREQFEKDIADLRTAETEPTTATEPTIA